MKKVVLTSLTLMGFASVCFAQNSATLQQSGTSQSSVQTQSGSYLTSTVTQGTDNNTTLNTYNQAVSDQSGSHQTATVLQDYITGHNQAVVTQKGGGPLVANGNTATIRRRTTVAEVFYAARRPVWVPMAPETMALFSNWVQATYLQSTNRFTAAAIMVR